MYVITAEQVWLLLLSRASFLHGYMYTTFSGFLVFENWPATRHTTRWLFC